MEEGHSCLQVPPQGQGHEGVKQGRQGQEPHLSHQGGLVKKQQHSPPLEVLIQQLFLLRVTPMVAFYKKLTNSVLVRGHLD